MASGREYGAAIFSPGLTEVLLFKHEEDGTWSFPFTSTTESNVHVVATALAVRQLLGIDIADKISRTHWLEAEFPQSGALVRLYVALGVRPETVTLYCTNGTSAQWHPLRSILPPVNAIFRADHTRAGASGEGGRVHPEEDDEVEDDSGDLLLEPGIAPFLAKLKALLDRHPEWRMAQLDPHLTRLIQEAITLPLPPPPPQPANLHNHHGAQQGQQQPQQQQPQQAVQQQPAAHDPHPQPQREAGQESVHPPPASTSHQPEQQPKGASEEGHIAADAAGTAAAPADAAPSDFAVGKSACGGLTGLSLIKVEPVEGAEEAVTGPVGMVPELDPAAEPQQSEAEPPPEQQQDGEGRREDGNGDGGQEDMSKEALPGAAAGEVARLGEPSGEVGGEGLSADGQMMDAAVGEGAAVAAEETTVAAGAATEAELEVEGAGVGGGGAADGAAADGGAESQSGAGGGEGGFWRGPRPQEHLAAYCRLHQIPEPCYSLVVKKFARRPVVTASCILPHLGVQVTPDMHVPGGMHAACQAAALAAILWMEGALPADGGEVVRVVPVGWPPLLSEARGESWEAAQVARRAGARRELDSAQREALLREMDKKRQRLVAEAAELERLMAALRGGEGVPEPDLTRLTASLGLGEGGAGAGAPAGAQGAKPGAAGGSAGGGAGKGAADGDGGAGLAGPVTVGLRALQFRSGGGPGPSAAAGAAGAAGTGAGAGGRGGGGRAPGTKRPREDVHSGGGAGQGEPSPGRGGRGKNVVMVGNLRNSATGGGGRSRSIASPPSRGVRGRGRGRRRP